MAEAKRLEVGKKAPDFTLVNHDGTKVKLSSLKGKKVIVYFFPAALTPGCTKEAEDFNSNLKALEKAGYAVLGVSPDTVEKMQKFQKAHKLKFALLADPDLTVHKKYGAYGTKRLHLHQQLLEVLAKRMLHFLPSVFYSISLWKKLKPRPSQLLLAPTKTPLRKYFEIHPRITQKVV